MSNSTNAVYHLRSANVWRSSQDFFPEQPLTHGPHVFDNALNSLWVQTFAVPDWDMFQTTHSAAHFHAAARAISGGPVYVSDKPEGHDFELLGKLMLSDGTVLRSRQPALPGREDCSSKTDAPWPVSQRSPTSTRLPASTRQSEFSACSTVMSRKTGPAMSRESMVRRMFTASPANDTRYVITARAACCWRERRIAFRSSSRVSASN